MNQVPFFCSLQYNFHSFFYFYLGIPVFLLTFAPDFKNSKLDETNNI